MASNVYSWPPLRTTGEYLTDSDTMSASMGLNGTPFFSQTQTPRRRWTANVSALHGAGYGHGYFTALKRILTNKPPLVRIEPLPRHWMRARDGDPTLGKRPFSWTTGGDPLAWTTDSNPLSFTTGQSITATAGTVGGADFIDCTGLPVSQVIATPGELVRSADDTEAFVLAPSTSNASGAARIYLTSAITSGAVLIGVRESIAMRIMQWPDMMQTTENYGWAFELQEVFATDFDGGFTEITMPWQMTRVPE